MNGKTVIIGVMGGAEATAEHVRAAYRLGQLVAGQGWVLLNGGRNSGIMEASAKGAFESGGMTVGILPDDNPRRASRFIRVPILTGMGSARNWINVLSSDVIVACPGGAGTISEIALALKAGKKVVLNDFDPGAIFEAYKDKGQLTYSKTPEEAVEIVKSILRKRSHEQNRPNKL